MNAGKVSFSSRIPYADWVYAKVSDDSCLLECMYCSDLANVCEEVRVMGLVEKIPACRGTTPKVIRTVESEAQNTSQCLPLSANGVCDGRFAKCITLFWPRRRAPWGENRRGSEATVIHPHGHHTIST